MTHGHQPDGKNPLDPLNPPQGGSGVPEVRSGVIWYEGKPYYAPNASGIIDNLQKALLPIPLIKTIPRNLEKSVPIQPGDRHHYDPLRDLEKQFHGSLDMENFFSKLNKFLDEEILPGRRPLGIPQLQAIDDFTKRYFYKKMPEVELWIVRGFIVGKMLETEERIPMGKAPSLNTLPGKVSAAVRDFNLSNSETGALEYAVSRGAQHLTNAANTTVTRVQNVLFDNIAKRGTNRQLRSALEGEFFTDEGEINRNWKRVAISETNFAFNQGYLMQMDAGEWVMGFSMPDRCGHCGALIDGKIYAVIQPKESLIYENDAPESKEAEAKKWLWEHAVWGGKDNVGRSGSARKRIDTGAGNHKENLVAREHHELYMPCVPMHPYCRCRWVRINPQTQYAQGGEIRMRVMDEDAWQRWHAARILPVLEKMKLYGINQ